MVKLVLSVLASGVLLAPSAEGGVQRAYTEAESDHAIGLPQLPVDHLVPFALRSVITTPHSVYLDSGGAHGGRPIGCANLTPP